MDLIALGRKAALEYSATLSIEHLPDALAELGDWPFNWLCARIHPQLGSMTPNLVALYHLQLQSISLQICMILANALMKERSKRATQSRDVQVDHCNILLNTYE